MLDFVIMDISLNGSLKKYINMLKSSAASRVTHYFSYNILIESCSIALLNVITERSPKLPERSVNWLAVIF